MEYLPLIFLLLVVFLCLLPLLLRKPKPTTKKPIPNRVSEYDSEGYNRQGYNEVGRNRQGKYNVPYGFRKTWHYDIGRILEASKKLQNTHISVGDFEVNKYRIKEHDLVFLDPPYTVSHNNNGFIEYNKNLFSLLDQERLARYIDYIKAKKAYYILTNAAHEEIQRIFTKDGDRRIEMRRNSLIGGRNAIRTEISEYVFTNIPEGEANNE